MSCFLLLTLSRGHLEIIQDYEVDASNSMLPELAAFHLIAGAFTCYLPNVVALLRHRALLRALPPVIDVTKPPSGSAQWPAGFRNTVGATGPLFASLSYGVLSASPDKAMWNINTSWGTYGLQPWQVATTCFVGDAALGRLGLGWQRRMAGWLFGAAYYAGGKALWKGTRTAVGNERVRFTTTTNAETGKVSIRVKVRHA